MQRNEYNHWKSSCKMGKLERINILLYLYISIFNWIIYYSHVTCVTNACVRATCFMEFDVNASVKHTCARGVFVRGSFVVFWFFINPISNFGFFLTLSLKVNPIYVKYTSSSIHHVKKNFFLLSFLIWFRLFEFFIQIKESRFISTRHFLTHPLRSVGWIVLG